MSSDVNMLSLIVSSNILTVLIFFTVNYALAVSLREFHWKDQSLLQFRSNKNHWKCQTRMKLKIMNNEETVTWHLL